MKKLLNPGIMALTVLASSQALANNFYIGMTAGQSTYDLIKGMEKPTAYEVFGGYQFNKYYSFEVAYNDFGDASENYVGNVVVGGQSYYYNFNTNIEARSLSTAIKLTLPASEKLEFYFKAGIHYWDFERQDYGINGLRDRSNLPVSFNIKQEDTDTQLMYGIGFDFNVYSNFNLGLRYSSFQVEDSDAITVFGLSGHYKFNIK